MRSGRQPQASQRLLFQLKAAGLRLRRLARDLAVPPGTFRSGSIREYPHRWTELTSPLRFAGAEPAFEDGKIHNLRLAASRLDGLVLRPGETFSFWHAVGPPWKARGFRIGREIRLGCLVPSVGGGLCQASGLLYDAARTLGFQIVEAHRHTRQLPDAPIPIERDATVFWNYVDLRFVASHEIRLAMSLDDTRLRLAIDGRVARTAPARKAFPVLANAPAASDCMTCGACTESLRAVRPFPVAAAHAALRSRLLELRRASAAERSVARAACLARAYAKEIRDSNGPLAVSQRLLPHLHAAGALKGRDYRVWLRHVPLDRMVQQLDRAAAIHPHAASLREYRPPQWLVSAERAALDGAAEIRTSHAWLADVEPRAVLAPQSDAANTSIAPRLRRAILFPGPTAAREGAFEVRQVARQLGAEVIVLGPLIEGPGFWSGIPTRRPQSTQLDWSEIAVVLHPTLFEASPTLHREAVRRGVPVIATRAAGLQPGTFIEVQFGDVAAIESATRALTHDLRAT